MLTTHVMLTTWCLLRNTMLTMQHILLWAFYMYIRHAHRGVALLRHSSCLRAGLLLREIHPYISTFILLVPVYCEWADEGGHNSLSVFIYSVRVTLDRHKGNLQGFFAFHLMASHITSQLVHVPAHDTGYITQQLWKCLWGYTPRALSYLLRYIPSIMGRPM